MKKLEEASAPSRINNLEVTADLSAVAPNTVRAWIRQGAPVVQVANKARGLPWKIDFAELLQWRCGRAVNDAITRTQDANGNLSREEAERRKAVAQATLAEIEADEKLSSFLLRADAERITKDFVDSIKEGLAPVPERIAGPAASMSDPNEIRELHEAEVNEAMRRAHAIFLAKCRPFEDSE